MENILLYIIVGVVIAVAAYALYERFGPTKCQQCGKRGGNKLVSEEIITRESAMVTKRRLRTTAERRAYERLHDRRATGTTVLDQVPGLKLTIRRAYRCPHCGYEYTSVDEETTTNLSA